MGQIGPETRNKRPISKKVQRHIRFRALHHFAVIAEKSVQLVRRGEQRQRDNDIRQSRRPLTVSDARRYHRNGKLLGILMDRLRSRE